MKYLLLIIYVIFSSIGMILINLSAKNTNLKIDSCVFYIRFNHYFIIGLFLYVISFFIWIFILQNFQLTYISPVAYGLVFIFISILSIIILKESVSIKNIIGFIFVFIGVLIANFKSFPK